MDKIREDAMSQQERRLQSLLVHSHVHILFTAHATGRELYRLIRAEESPQKREVRLARRMEGASKTRSFIYGSYRM